MCGIAGLVARNQPPAAMRATLSKMGEALRRRGPDGFGLWTDPEPVGDYAVGFAHTRLSIQDLSELGAQPMLSPSGQWVITFNGEIYNFIQIRAELELQGISFKGGSDTEVICSALEQWGVNRTLRRIDGMFALAAYDRSERRLYIARDRLGEKPLCYSCTSEGLSFASTLAALRKLPNWRDTLSSQAVAFFLRYRYVPAPLTIFEDARKLPPGHVASWSIDRPTESLQVESFWEVPTGFSVAGARTRQELVGELDEILSSVVSEQLIADRSLGAFLSGGVDSSLIAAKMCELSDRKVKTFTVGFEEAEFNESNFAREIAHYLGTDHTEVILPAKSGLDLIPTLPEVYDEPFADASQLPTLMVARAAREEVVVALSGDGGDESFAGYDRYFECRDSWSRQCRLPGALRKIGASMSVLAATGPFEWLATQAMQTFYEKGRGRRAGSVFRRLADEFSAADILDLYRYKLALSRESLSSSELSGGWLDTSAFRGVSSDLRKMMQVDLHNYLPDDVLVKVDRATMFFGLESRAPLLDRRVVEFACHLPEQELVEGERRGKQLLRRLLDQKIPSKLTDRPKRGFAVPLASWLRKDLREWAESLLTPEALRSSGLLDTQLVTQRWRQHVDGVWDNSALMWNVLQFQSWLLHRAQ